MDVLIVGSIAYDSITSPQGFAPHTLAGPQPMLDWPQLSIKDV